MNALAMQIWTPEFECQNPRISLKARRSSTGVCNPSTPTGNGRDRRFSRASTTSSLGLNRPRGARLAPKNRGRPYTRCDTVPALCHLPGLLLSTRRKMNSQKGQRLPLLEFWASPQPPAKFEGVASFLCSQTRLSSALGSWADRQLKPQGEVLFPKNVPI